MGGRRVPGGDRMSEERLWACAALAGYGWVMLSVIYLAVGLMSRG